MFFGNIISVMEEFWLELKLQLQQVTFQNINTFFHQKIVNFFR